MKMTIENTEKIISFDGIECRVWEGVTERGVPVIAFIPRVAARKDSDCGEFEAELRETVPPSAAAMQFPTRMVL